MDVLLWIILFFKLIEGVLVDFGTFHCFGGSLWIISNRIFIANFLPGCFLNLFSIFNSHLFLNHFPNQ